MSVRLLIHDELVYEGESVAIPRVGEAVRRGEEFLPVEGVTWDFRDGGAVTVTLITGSRPYTY
jgi:hypothetical protein